MKVNTYRVLLFILCVWMQTGTLVRGQGKPCSRPNDVPLATFNLTKGDDFVIGSEVQYTCQTGYQVVSGSRKRSCTLNGWNGTVPICEVCSSYIGINYKQQLIEEDQLTASSASYGYGGREARLGGRGNWYAEHADDHQWLQVDLKGPQTTTGIITQGARWGDHDYYVTTFRVSYSDDDRGNWTVVTDANGSEKIFIGNTDCCHYATNMFDRPITSRFVRVLPRTWSNSIGLRIELLGCEL